MKCHAMAEYPLNLNVRICYGINVTNVKTVLLIVKKILLNVWYNKNFDHAKYSVEQKMAKSDKDL